MSRKVKVRPRSLISQCHMVPRRLLSRETEIYRSKSGLSRLHNVPFSLNSTSVQCRQLLHWDHLSGSLLGLNSMWRGRCCATLRNGLRTDKNLSITGPFPFETETSGRKGLPFGENRLKYTLTLSPKCCNATQIRQDTAVKGTDSIFEGVQMCARASSLLRNLRYELAQCHQMIA